MCWPIFRGRPHRAWGKVVALWCRLRGRHTAENGDWGYGGNGLVDRFCPNCMKRVRREPLDDCHVQEDVLDTWEWAKGLPP